MSAAATHRAVCIATSHPALLTHLCGNCGERLWGATVCPHCRHKNEPPRCGNTRAAMKISCAEQKQAS